MKKKILFIILIMLFILNTILVITNNSFIYDDIIYDVIISLKSEVLTKILIFLTNLSSTKFIIGANILLVIFIIIGKKTKLLLITISSITSGIVNTLLKNIISRPRPDILPMVIEDTFSYPSGHSMIAILFYGMTLYLVLKHKIKGYRIISVILGIYILCVGISRIYLGVHFPSDVIGGYLLGVIILLLLTELYKKYNKE